ncbi:MAG: cell division protein FtsA [Verrucomicrobiota bacterium]
MFFKKEPDVVVALEVGTSKVVAAVGELRKDGSLYLLGVGEAKSSGVRKGEVVDFQTAQQTISEAVSDAENKTEVMVGEVFLAVTGSHITSRTVRVKTNTDDEDHMITPRHVEDLDALAQQQPIPADHAVIHQLLQHYYIDEKTRSTHPIGLNSHHLEATYQVIHGLENKLACAVRSVAELDVDVRGLALAPYASAQAILTRDQKNQGSVVIDLGAGTTDYVVYLDGAIIHTGVLGVGGDHMTQDISLGLKLPYQRAEMVKLKHGLLSPKGIHPDEQITLERDHHYDERSIYTHSLAKIMYARQWETLNMVREDLNQLNLWPRLSSGIYFTGGASQVRGLREVAKELFPVPVQLVQEFSFEGDLTFSRRPDLSTVLGLLQYAQNYETIHPKKAGFGRVVELFQNALSMVGLF